MTCFDEVELLGDVRPPVKAKPGRVERYDTEYRPCNRRSERRTAVDPLSTISTPTS